MDPARAKVEQYSNATPISVQPVSSYNNYTGVTAAPHQPMVVASVPTSYNSNPLQYSQPGGPNPLFQNNGRQYPQGRWGDSICDWPTNIYPSCYCVCCVCCGMYLAAQSKFLMNNVSYMSFPCS